MVEAEKFNIIYTDPTQLISTSDKLRYYRYKKALRQKDVAAYIGIDLSTYVKYEQVNRDYYPLEQISKIAELLEVEVENLLDDYNLFLYRGQGQQIKALRKSVKLSQGEFGKLIGVASRRTVESWEWDKSIVSKRVWEHIVHIKNQTAGNPAV